MYDSMILSIKWSVYRHDTLTCCVAGQLRLIFSDLLVQHGPVPHQHHRRVGHAYELQVEDEQQRKSGQARLPRHKRLRHDTQDLDRCF